MQQAGCSKEGDAVKQGFKVVDMDLHVMEPITIFDERLPEPYRSRTRIEFGTAHGHQGQSSITFHVGDLSFSPYNEFVSRQALRRFQSGLPSDAHLAAVNTGVTPELLLEGMEWEGIDVAGIVPTVMFVITSCDGLEPDHALALCRVFNDWCSELVQFDPTRLRYWAWLPRQDAELAAAEARRAVTELGAAGVAVTSGAVDGRLLSDPFFEPLWSEIESLAVPFATHVWGANPAMGDDDGRRYWGEPRAELPLLALNGRKNGMSTMAELVLGGVLESHPGLHVSVMEAGCAWLLDLLPVMDDVWELYEPEATVSLTMKPSDYVRRQCFVTCEGDEPALRYLADYGLENTITFSTDYPHHNAAWPHAVDNLLGQPELSDEVKRKILWDNSARLFQWHEAPVVAPSG
jgi:predicted TIM-barrel fold metal-dependent hydrolase